MKTMKILKIQVLSVLTIVVLSFTSCLKDPRYIDYSASPPLVEFPLASFNSNKTIVLGPSPYTIAANPATFTGTETITRVNGLAVLPVTVNLASAEVLKQDVTFTVSVDNSTLTAAAPSTTKASAVTPATTSTPIPTYYPLPAADYTLVNASGVIPAGQRTAVVNVNLNTTLIGSSTKNYALRLVITSSSVQISNWNVQTYLFQLQ